MSAQRCTDYYNLMATQDCIITGQRKGHRCSKLGIAIQGYNFDLNIVVGIADFLAFDPNIVAKKDTDLGTAIKQGLDRIPVNIHLLVQLAFDSHYRCSFSFYTSNTKKCCRYK